jgi:hypothetical protein
MNCQIPRHRPWIGLDVEARLDEREARQLRRQPLVPEDALHVREVAMGDAKRPLANFS